MKKLKNLIKEWSTDMGREFVRGNNCLKTLGEMFSIYRDQINAN